MQKILPRPPIVAILGHVDHGKTTLLDFIRKSNVADKEEGGITQRIGAYEITTDIKGYPTNKITFIDTPGHEAFSQLRSRGANVADIAILLIDGIDSVMPQTAESIAHIKAAKIPYLVVVNKMDLPEANPEKVKNDLLKFEVLVEGKGGNVPMITLSAKTGKGVQELLETILLITSDMHLQFAKENNPKAVIVETKKDRRGIVVSAIMRDGILKIGDVISADGKKAKIRSFMSAQGKPLSEVAPSTPFELYGFSEAPNVGSTIELEKNSVQSSPLASTQPVSESDKKIDLDALLHPVKEEQKLSIVLKADSEGSLGAITQALAKNEHISIVLKGVGEIYKSDVFLAKATKSIIIGFAIPVSDEARNLAKQEKVIIKTYNIIYHLLEELDEVASLLLEKKQQEKSVKGTAKILATFTIEGEKIFGVKVTKGKFNLADNVEIYRNENLIGKTKLVSLKIRAKTVSEVKKDMESGMIFSPLLDIRVGDVIKSVL